MNAYATLLAIVAIAAATANAQVVWLAISKPPPLTFQILPMLTMHKTVEYLKGRSKYSIGLNMDKHNKSKAVLTPLLSVSERWRRAALESICDNCALDFDHSHEAREIVFPAWPADFKLAQLRKSNMAKSVVY
ncbi:hypothetical protein GGI03_001380 [Coemansia sp. RSA 2337]|nr:hypothetical protein GGI03_001380 [Coemansia sp. RSA 2337]